MQFRERDNQYANSDSRAQKRKKKPNREYDFENVKSSRKDYMKKDKIKKYRRYDDSEDI
jgi:hypothetical protein